MGFFDGWFAADANRRANNSANLDGQMKQLQLKMATDAYQRSQEMYARMQAQGGPASGDSLADYLESQVYIQPRASDATAYANAAARTRKDNVDAAREAQNMRIQNLTKISNAYGNVHSAADWYTTNKDLMAAGIVMPWMFGPDKKSLAPYNPQLVEDVKHWSTNESTKALNENRVVLRHESEERQKLDKLREAQVKEQTHHLQLLDDKLAKEGVGRPPAGLIKDMSDMITSDYGTDLIDANTASPASGRAWINRSARIMADKVVDLMHSTSGLSQGEAEKMVYQQAKQDGTFAGISPNAAMKGRVNSAPLPMPTSRDSDPAKAKEEVKKHLTVNKWYSYNGPDYRDPTTGDTLHKGDPVMWNGEAFISKAEYDRMVSGDDGDVTQSAVAEVTVQDEEGNDVTLYQGKDGTWRNEEGDEVNIADYKQAGQ